MTSESKNFDSRGNFVLLWRIRGTELREAARLVWQGGTIQLQAEDGSSHDLQELYRPAQLLMGLCLEATLKGLLVERDPTLISGGKIARDLVTHSLEKLFQKASLPLVDPENELNLVRKLSDAVAWVAKYPVPLNAYQLIHPQHGSKRTLTRRGTDFACFEDLWRRIDVEFESPLPRSAFREIGAGERD